MYELCPDVQKVCIYCISLDLQHNMCIWLQIEASGEDDIVIALAALSPFTAADTREGLHSKLRQLHGDTEGEAERLTWRQRIR